MKTRFHLTLPKSKQKSRIATVVALVISLSVFGLLMVYNSSSVSALKDFNDKYFYFKEQGKWLIVGLIALIVCSQIKYTLLQKIALAQLVAVIILLLAVFIPGLGVTAYGARRWIDLGFFVLQPAELAKISLIIYFSAWFTNPEKQRLTAFLLLLGIVIGLVILEPDLGTAIIITAVSLIIYFLSGPGVKQFLFLIPVLVTAAVVAALTSPYRLKRILTFLDPQADPLGASYHISQVLIALGSGGLFGLGLGKSRQKYLYLPEATTDSIFAIIAEEVGFIGCLVFLGLYLYLIYNCFKIAQSATDRFGYLLGMGITFWIAVQALINLSAMTVVLPLTGVPLPFISYGGSGLIVSLASIGILLSIAKYNK